ncbi:spore cortex biosynthesis protein YabQ [Peptococcaceae bacterium 1198_IL3148]
MFAFIMTIIIGVLAGLLFDLYRVIAQLFNLKKWGLMIGDILYWLILTPVVFIILLWGNGGEVRFYVVIGLAIGAILYLQLLSQPITPLIKGFFNIVKQSINLAVKLFKLIWKALCLPFKVVFVVVTAPVGFVFKLLKKLGVGINKPVNRLIGKLRLWIKPKQE